MIDVISNYLLTIHIAAGSISLILFWIPAFARKRKGLHTAVGKWYVYMMWIVVLSAAILSIKNVIIGNYIMAMFLGFLSLITANPLWFARSVLKSKKSFSPAYIRRHVVLHSLIVVFGAFLITYGLFYVDSGVRFLMIFFGILGVLDIRELINARSMASQNPDWYKIHYTGMITTGIAAYTAFLAFGGRTLLENVLTNEWQFLPWIAPTIIGTIFIRRMSSKRAVLSRG